MKQGRLNWFCIGLLFEFFLLSSLHASLTEQLNLANASMIKHHPLEALSLYQSLLASSELPQKSPTIWYLRGLAEEEIGDFPAASLSFRRALILNPQLEVARQHFIHVLKLLGIASSLSWSERLDALLHREKLMFASVALGWIGVITFVIVWMRKPKRKDLIILTILMSILGHGVFILATFVDSRRTAGTKSIVIAKHPPFLRQTPSDNSDIIATIPPGTTLTLLSQNGSWCYVAVNGNLTGWITKEVLTPLLPNKHEGWN